MFVKDQAVHIVGEIGEADFGFGTGQADGADHQAEAILLPGENMFDAGADARFLGIGRSRRLGHGTAARFLAVDLALKHVLGEPAFVGLGAVGAIGPNIGTGIVGGQQTAQKAAFAGRSWCYDPGADEAESPIDGKMGFVAKEGRADWR